MYLGNYILIFCIRNKICTQISSNPLWFFRMESDCSQLFFSLYVWKGGFVILCLQRLTEKNQMPSRSETLPDVIYI